MGRRKSRVAEEAREAELRAQEVQRKIKELTTQISNPQKYFAPPPHDRSSSTVEKFRRYFAVERGDVRVERRKPTRSEMRAQRNRAILWAIGAFILLIWVFGKLSQVMHSREVPAEQKTNSMP